MPRSWSSRHQVRRRLHRLGSVLHRIGVPAHSDPEPMRGQSPSCPLLPRLSCDRHRDSFREAPTAGSGIHTPLSGCVMAPRPGHPGPRAPQSRSDYLSGGSRSTGAFAPSEEDVEDARHPFRPGRTVAAWASSPTATDRERPPRRDAQRILTIQRRPPGPNPRHRRGTGRSVTAPVRPLSEVAFSARGTDAHGAGSQPCRRHGEVVSPEVP
jgi:hypothetical protein